MSRAQDLLEEGEKLLEVESWPEALQKFKDALALFRKAGTDYEVAATAFKIACFPDDVAGYLRRRACAREAAALFKRLGKLGEAAMVRNHLADMQQEKSRVFSEFGSWLAWWLGKCANRNRKKAIDLYERAGMALESARIRCDLGQELQVYEENYAAALRLYDLAEPVLRSLGDDDDVATLLFLKGNALFFQRGGNAEVVGLLRDALNLFQKLGDRHGTALAFKYIVEAVAAYDPDAARHYANRGLAFARENENDSLAQDIQDLLSRMED